MNDRRSDEGTADFAAAVQSIINDDRKRNQVVQRRRGSPPTGESVDMADRRPGKNTVGAAAAAMSYHPPPPMLGTIYSGPDRIVNRNVVPSLSRVIGWRRSPDPTAQQTGTLGVDLNSGTFRGWGDYATYGSSE